MKLGTPDLNITFFFTDRLVISTPFCILSYVLLWFVPSDSMPEAACVLWFLTVACLFKTLMSVSVYSFNRKPLRVYSHQESHLVRLFGPDQKRTLFFSCGAVCFHIVLFASELLLVNKATRMTIIAPIGQK
ncbi:hypothetical protein XENOCAPTIV_013673 [Xenoophorus captivus]|uniref:Uncharacterized protein n=1 Tax=Xenoophorus captivus TaxID=1517983 RepID=A0ABV0RYT0_9TELE